MDKIKKKTIISTQFVHAPFNRDKKRKKNQRARWICTSDRKKIGQSGGTTLAKSQRKNTFLVALFSPLPKTFSKISEIFFTSLN